MLSACTILFSAFIGDVCNINVRLKKLPLSVVALFFFQLYSRFSNNEETF